MKPMATVTFFVPARRWRLYSDRFVGDDLLYGADARRLPRLRADLYIALGSVLLTLLLSVSVRADSSPVGTAEEQQEDRPLDIVSGMTYRAGTRVKIPGTDWSFVVPDRWQSNRPDDAEMPFLMPEEGKELGMIFPLTEVTRESVRDQFSQPLSLLHGLSFVPAGSETETEASIARSFQGDDMAGRALAVFGPGNTAVIYFLMGPSDQASGFQAVLERLAGSTRFVDSAPGHEVGL